MIAKEYDLKINSPADLIDDADNTILYGTVALEYAGVRLDAALTSCFPDYSRTRLTSWFKEGLIVCSNPQLKARDRVLGGETFTLQLPHVAETVAQAEDIALDLVHVDDDIIVINKPAGLVVHPGAGNQQGTLLNAILFHFPKNAELPRAGIVHRLDKDTSGLMVVARSARAQLSLVEQLQVHSMGREYIAVTCGIPTAGDTIDEPISRHAVDRQRMAVQPLGKPATTHFRVTERYRAHALITCQLETGRTHQIRVHLSFRRYPLFGDLMYGARLKLPTRMSVEHAAVLREFKRQALHAQRLTLHHPATGERMHWLCDAPADLHQLIETLRCDSRLFDL